MMSQSVSPVRKPATRVIKAVNALRDLASKFPHIQVIEGPNGPQISDSDLFELDRLVREAS